MADSVGKLGGRVVGFAGGLFACRLDCQGKTEHFAANCLERRGRIRPGRHPRRHPRDRQLNLEDPEGTSRGTSDWVSLAYQDRQANRKENMIEAGQHYWGRKRGKQRNCPTCCS